MNKKDRRLYKILHNLRNGKEIVEVDGILKWKDNCGPSLRRQLVGKLQRFNFIDDSYKLTEQGKMAAVFSREFWKESY